MKLFIKLLFVLSGLSLVMPAFADDSSYETDDIDQEITNERLRAESGSKNKLSFKGKFNYQGGSIVKPFGKLRPNIIGDPSVKTSTSLTGTVGVQYRLTKNDSLALQVGVGLNEPTAISYEDDFSDASFIDNPTLTYSKVYKAFSLQNITSFAVKLFTDEDITDRGSEVEFNLSHTLLKSYGKLSLGLANTLAYSMEDDEADNYVGDNSFIQIYAGIFPFAEYKLDKTFSLRTVSGPLYFFKILDAADGQDEWVQAPWYQSVGVGISVNRDFYVYPNVQFLWEDLRNDYTNFAISANVNF